MNDKVNLLFGYEVCIKLINSTEKKPTTRKSFGILPQGYCERNTHKYCYFN